MKELVVISGKGGTGKTSIVSAFAALAKNKVMVDCDVDAADLHLILKPQIEKTTKFYCGKTAKIQKEICNKCGRCIEVCRFEAISKDFEIDEIKCEGCGACFYQCPVNAIKLEESQSGEWFESNTRFGKLIHARLGIGEENSGKLVSKIRNHARLIAQKEGCALIIVDGSPGIGCPVIASISGASVVVIVTEPTLSGFHDAERVFKLTQHFNIPASMCINKYDLNLELTEKMEQFCEEKGIELVGKISYNNIFTQAMIKELSVIEFEENNEVSKEVKKMWEKIENKLI
jgi:MinD superfamily P-loop ATPase